MSLGQILPPLNASMNATAGLLLIAGRIAVQSGRRRLHRNLMLLAVLASSLFLAGYLLHHFLHGIVRYQGTGMLRTVYLVILASHTTLAMVLVPLVLAALYRGLRGETAMHRRIARIAFPVWLYVSATGVIIYLMLYQL